MTLKPFLAVVLGVVVVTGIAGVPRDQAGGVAAAAQVSDPFEAAASNGRLTQEGLSRCYRYLHALAGPRRADHGADSA